MTTPAHARTISAAACLLAVTVTGCSGSDHPARTSSSTRTPTSSTSSSSVTHPSGSTPTQTPYPTSSTKPNPRGMSHGLDGVNRQEAEATAKAFLTALNTQDGRTDTSPRNAADRAADLATAAYAAQLRTPMESAPGADFQDLIQQKGYTSAQVKVTTSDDPPPSSPTDTYLTFTVTVTTHGPKTAPLTSTNFVHLTRPAAGTAWQVASNTATYQ